MVASESLDEQIVGHFGSMFGLTHADAGEFAQEWMVVGEGGSEPVEAVEEEINMLGGLKGATEQSR